MLLVVVINGKWINLVFITLYLYIFVKKSNKHIVQLRGSVLGMFQGKGNSKRNVYEWNYVVGNLWFVTGNRH
jgi:hypothetical protein